MEWLVNGGMEWLVSGRMYRRLGYGVVGELSNIQKVYIWSGW